MKLQDEKSAYIGHRRRLLNKFILNPRHTPDYELLEILLFYVFQRKDTKPLAKTLLNHFKSLRKIILADYFDLKQINGVGKSTINLIMVLREFFTRSLLEKVIESESIMSTGQVLEYYKNTLGYLKKEQLRIMFLNNKNKLITEEMIQEGTINNTAIYPREIIQKSLEYGASAIIMVHNHPGGDPKPSRQDIVMTKIISEIAQKLDITLFDHIIIGKMGTVSLKELGVI
ncbi:MAG: DNA repair protein RadC [Holosporaceae bacterium]|jgi:DNA repair protein RadC|nr:DNA repair protein RadC [Holosporaceae bacterium]